MEMLVKYLSLFTIVLCFAFGTPTSSQANPTFKFSDEAKLDQIEGIPVQVTNYIGNSKIAKMINNQHFLAIRSDDKSDCIGRYCISFIVLRCKNLACPYVSTMLSDTISISDELFKLPEIDEPLIQIYDKNNHLLTIFINSRSIFVWPIPLGLK